MKGAETLKRVAADPIAVLIAALLTPFFASPQESVSIHGQVLGEAGSAPRSTVRVPATAFATTTGDDGRFTLWIPVTTLPARLTASAPGHYIGISDVIEVATEVVEISLAAYPDTDHREYQWLSATGTGVKGECVHCHAAVGDGPPLPVDQWRRDAHARSLANHRFRTLYTGTDVNGNRSPPTRFGRSRDYGRFPLRPDPAEPNYGPGYRLDFPDTAGNCAACHAPAAAVDSPLTADPTEATGVGQEGIGCDFCHKVVDVVLDPETGRPYPNRPGVMSFVLRRPGEGHQLFAGPFDDVAPGEDVHAPVFRESRYCAPCHHAVFWGTLVYDSFGEWLASPYADPGSSHASTCQDCHMPRGGADHFARLDRGGRVRDPATIATHLMTAIADSALMASAAQLDLDAVRRDGVVEVAARVHNSGTGHHLPTGSPLRQVLLVVEALDGEGRRLQLEGGPILPEWTVDLAGRPGVAYAKILEESWTQVWPTAAYWSPTRIRSDTRLPALAEHVTRYRFAADQDIPVIVSARLLYRRAYRELAMQKGWNDPDLVMTTRTATLAATAH